MTTPGLSSLNESKLLVKDARLKVEENNFPKHYNHQIENELKQQPSIVEVEIDKDVETISVVYKVSKNSVPRPCTSKAIIVIRNFCFIKIRIENISTAARRLIVKLLLLLIPYTIIYISTLKYQRIQKKGIFRQLFLY